MVTVTFERSIEQGLVAVAQLADHPPSPSPAIPSDPAEALTKAGISNPGPPLGPALTYTIFGPVNWAVVAVLAPRHVGGIIGARIAQRLPSEVIRWTIVVFATVVAVVLLLT